MRFTSLTFAALLATACASKEPGGPDPDPDPDPDPAVETILTVNINATGDDIDQDYRVWVGSQQSLAVAGTPVTFRLTEGVTHARLQGIRHNCTAERYGSEPINVVNHAATVTFTVACRAFSPVSVRVSVEQEVPSDAVFWLDMDHDDCTVGEPGGGLFGENGQPATTTGCATRLGSTPVELRVPQGLRAMKLLLPDGRGCRAAGSTRFDLPVPASGIMDVKYRVRCDNVAPAPTEVRVTVRATGASLPSRYRIMFAPANDWGWARDLANNESSTFADLPDGLGVGSVELIGLPARCSIASGTLKSWLAPVPSTLDVVYDVVCS